VKFCTPFLIIGAIDIGSRFAVLMFFFLLVCNFLARSNVALFDTRYSVTESRTTTGQDGSGIKSQVNLGSGCGLVTLVMGLGPGRVKKIGPTSNCDLLRLRSRSYS